MKCYIRCFISLYTVWALFTLIARLNFLNIVCVCKHVQSCRFSNLSAFIKLAFLLQLLFTHFNKSAFDIKFCCQLYINNFTTYSLCAPLHFILCMFFCYHILGFIYLRQQWICMKKAKTGRQSKLVMYSQHASKFW